MSDNILSMAEASERPSNVAAIEACTLMNALTAGERQTLIDRSHMAYAERGETIWMAGAPSEFSAIVATGFLKLTKGTTSGQEVAMDLIGPGQLVGLLAAVEGRPFPLSAVAVTPTWYLKIPTGALMEVYHASGPLKDQIVRTMGPRLRRAHSMMTRLSTGSAEERIAAVLFLLADSYGKSKGIKIRLGVPLTRQEIGEMAGTTVETTIRVMSKWQKEGLIATDHQIVTILDAPRLEIVLRD